MTDKEELYYLINEYLMGNYKTINFVDLFYVKYNQNTDHAQLSDIERQAFRALNIIIGRHTPFESDLLNYPNTYYSDEDVWEKAKETMKLLDEVNNK